jgi:hypothetical protein
MLDDRAALVTLLLFLGLDHGQELTDILFGIDVF